MARRRLADTAVAAVAAAAASVAARGEKSGEEEGGKERADPAAFPLHSLDPRVLKLIGARTGGGRSRPSPPPAASAGLSVLNEAAFA